MQRSIFRVVQRELTKCQKAYNRDYANVQMNDDDVIKPIDEYECSSRMTRSETEEHSYSYS